jgi:hypothetical protein
VAYEENNDAKTENIYSKRIRAGKRRTYFFDVRSTKGNDYYLTITESRKRFNDDGYDRHKIFLYKEDFNKFVKALGEAVDFVKTDLMPDFDFDAFNHDEYEMNGNGNGYQHAEVNAEVVAVEVPVVADVNDVIEEAVAVEPVVDQASTDSQPEIDNGANEVAEKW